jgi:hypothetical protein
MKMRGKERIKVIPNRLRQNELWFSVVTTRQSTVARRLVFLFWDSEDPIQKQRFTDQFDFILKDVETLSQKSLDLLLDLFSSISFFKALHTKVGVFPLISCHTSIAGFDFRLG